MRILAIDPGTTRSAWVCLDSMEIFSHGIDENAHMLSVIGNHRDFADALCIEMIESFGMAIGKSTIETILWIGRFAQHWDHWALGKRSPARLIYRGEVKVHLCGSRRAKDGNIRQACIDRYPRTGGGKIPQIGTKKKPGPCYGIRADEWQALGLGLTLFDRSRL